MLNTAMQVCDFLGVLTQCKECIFLLIIALHVSSMLKRTVKIISLI